MRVEGEGGEGRGESTSGMLASHCVACGLLNGGRRAMISWREALMAAKARSSCCWVMYAAVVEGDGSDGGEEEGTEDGELCGAVAGSGGAEGRVHGEEAAWCAAESICPAAGLC